MMSWDYRMKNIYQEMKEGYGIDQKTVDVWKSKYQGTLRRYVEEVDGMKVGDIAEIVAVDETPLSRDDSKIFKTNDTMTKGRRIGSHKKNPLLKRILPSRTIWKKPAAKTSEKILKKLSSTRYYKKKVGSLDDKRSSSRWLWGAVEVGSKTSGEKSHKLGNTRVSIGFLPRQKMRRKGSPGERRA